MTMMDTAKLKVFDVSCIRQDKFLFENISFQLKAGEVLHIEGPNGSGKSSLLRLITGLMTPTNGEICWRGEPIKFLRADYWQELHFIGHANGIKLGLTVLENLRLLNCNTEFEPTLSHLRLDQHKHIQAKYLSAGQKRRLALAKLFLVPKKLWILDEPLTALDTATQNIFLSALNKHIKDGGIAIISSHQTISLANTTVEKLVLC